MPTRKLTTTALPTLSPGEWYDAVLPGLILRVGARRRTWTFRYHSGGRYHRRPIGHFPAMPLADARDAARRMIARLDSGAPAEIPAPHPRASTALSLGTLIDKYEATRLREGGRIKRLSKALRALRRHLGPYLSLPADQFAKADLRAARDALIEAGKPVEANRMLAAASAMLRWASHEDLIEVNFAASIRRTPEHKRDRVLSKAEIAAIWHACENFPPRDVAGNYGRMIKFLLLTGQRLGEAAALKHGDVLNGTWKQTINKASRPHSLPLPPLALELIGHGEARDYVFPGRYGQLRGFAKWKPMLDEASGVEGWRVHDLRRTAASQMQDLSIRNEIVQSILNHSLPGVAGVYLRSELEQQKAEALATWAAALTKIVGPARALA